ncbi:MAG: hypothetical protein LBH46_01255 [Rickettsiales bacterium]|nr:hypothetical protein [Rickettsiales bacterium]
MKSLIFSLILAVSTVSAKEISINWTKDETILLMDTYIKIRPKYDNYNPQIRRLSNFLSSTKKMNNSSYRSASDVYFNMLALQRLDDKYKNNIRKIIRPTKIQKQVWEEYKDNLKKLKEDAILIMEKMKKGETE